MVMTQQVSSVNSEGLTVKQEIMEVIKAALIGGIVGFILCFLVNYFLIPVPTSALDNGIGNGISGAVSGMTGGWAGIGMYFISQHRKKNKKMKED